MSARTNRPKVGDRVVVERDETLYPSRRSWPKFRGKRGTVVAVSRAAGEIGVTFGSPDSHDRKVTWFLPHELRVTDPGDRPLVKPRSDATGSEVLVGGVA